MRPPPPLVMQAAVKVVEEVALGLTDEQEITRLRGVISLLTILQHEWETCAANPIAGITRYAEIVRQGSLLMTGERRAALRRALAAGDDFASDYRISSLEAALDQLRAAIIELQSWLEDADGPRERALLADIWVAEYEEACREDRNTPLW